MKTHDEILAYVMGQCTGGFEGAAQEAYDRLSEYVAKHGANASIDWEECEVCDYEPFTEYTIGDFLKHIDAEIDSLESFINSKPSCIASIDKELLRKQREALNTVIAYGDVVATDKEALEGIQNLLDAIQDELDKGY